MDTVSRIACLYLDEHLTGAVAVVSRDLDSWLDDQEVRPSNQRSHLGQTVRHIAVALQSVFANDGVDGTEWTILPVRAQTDQEKEAHIVEENSIALPNSPLDFGAFWRCLKAYQITENRLLGHGGLQVKVLDVEPLDLDTVTIEVDQNALEKHFDIQKQFRGGFLDSRTNSFTGKARSRSGGQLKTQRNKKEIQSARRPDDEQIVSAIREALQSVCIVRQEDFLSLPLPTHPITHASFPPAKITSCEPVNQGLIADRTCIILRRTSGTPVWQRERTNSAPAIDMVDGFGGEDGDTSNDQFFSAIEEEEDVKAKALVNHEGKGNSDVSERESESSSDDSTGNVISLNAPPIGIQGTGILSSKTAATPRAGWSMKNGPETPGSVMSNYTTNTARRISSRQSKTFRARNLLERIPNELLHPRPALYEEDEARVFVDMKALLRLGCFSGDWVKIEADPQAHNIAPELWGLDWQQNGGGPPGFRPAKVYAFSDLNSQRLHSHRNEIRKSSRSGSMSSSALNRPAPLAWLPPMLLFNLGEPATIRISPLLHGHRGNANARPTSQSANFERSTEPPLAREVTLLRVSSPLSTERDLQTGLFEALKAYFERKRRIIMPNDLIALPFDINISRFLAAPSNTTDGESEIERILEMTASDQFEDRGIVWFRVGQIAYHDREESLDLSADMWGGAASIEPLKTRMRQVGSEQCRVPSTLDSPWEIFYGVKPHPHARALQQTLARYTASTRKSFILPLRRRLRELMGAATSPSAQYIGMDPIVVCLHSTQRDTGKATLAIDAAADLGLHVFQIDAYDILTETSTGGDVKSEAYLRARMERALACGPEYTAIVLRNVEVLTADRLVTALKEAVRDIRMLITTTTSLEKVSEDVRSLFTHEFEVSAPDEGEREGILKNVIQGRGSEIASDVDLSSIALKTAALVAGNLVDIVDRATTLKQTRLESFIAKRSSVERPTLMRDLLISGGEFGRAVSKADFDFGVEAARKNFSGAIGAPKIPNVSWNDVGGLENVKDAVVETIQLPLERPELFAKGMKKRSGILFYGPPGTGKTLLAKAIATEFSLNFFSVKGPELLNMYIGESEANVRRVFQRARDARPCVVFFDELDSVAPKRGNQGDSGGVMDRIVSQLLAELDGMSDGEEGGGGVFVIGATNRPDLLDQALLRPGRFDKMLYLGISDTHDKQLRILEALTRKFNLQSDLSLHRVAESLPFTYTGADLYALCSDAMLKAITRQTAIVDAKIRALPGGPVSTAYFFDHLAQKEDMTVVVTEADFQAAKDELVGSVS